MYHEHVSHQMQHGMINPGPALVCVLSPNVHVCLIDRLMDRKEVAPFFNFIRCHVGLVCAPAALQSLSAAVCVRMICVNSASSAVLCAFPQSPSSKGRIVE